ncbi:MAG TPA: hydantoinase/carbamoylase family amidase [Conexibacter sp.]|nr:hydantoinase/carbamoylase family amidase [Conexibacter sp.]
MKDELARRLSALEPIGLDPSGATTRLAWTPEDASAGAWFCAQAAELGLRVERDPAGNRWAVPDAAPPWWAVGSHLDSVRDGGRFDGALGVAAAFAVAGRCSQPVAVIALADEEGARFNTPTFGSKALAGALDVAGVLDRVDDDGVRLRDALAGAGIDPAALSAAPGWLDRLRGFVELHIDQNRAVAAAGVPAGVVSALATRMRLRVAIDGQADHAGSTHGEERHDALGAAARLIVAAQDLGEAVDGLVVSATRILVEPNALTTIPASVQLWVDGRSAAPDTLVAWERALHEQAQSIAQRLRVTIALERASHTLGVSFDERVRGALSEASARRGAAAHEFLCFAGHDAGVLAQRVPAGMVLVRNETGISHAPAEDVDLDDAALAASVVLDAIEELAAP